MVNGQYKYSSKNIKLKSGLRKHCTIPPHAHVCIYFSVLSETEVTLTQAHVHTQTGTHTHTPSVTHTSHTPLCFLPTLLPRSVSGLLLQDALSWRGSKRLSRPWHPLLPLGHRTPPGPPPTLRHWSPLLQKAVSTRCQGKVGRGPASKPEKAEGWLQSQLRPRGAG